MRIPSSQKPLYVAKEAWDEASEYLRYMLVKAYRRHFQDGGRLSHGQGRR